jgi:hypothetical protein
MKLPGQLIAEIPKQKILDYLLSNTHPVGWAKARFFQMHGFERHNWELLSERLMDHARQNDVMKTEESRFGIKYIIKGGLPCPNGQSPTVCAVWFVAAGEETSRLVTDFPAEEDK